MNILVKWPSRARVEKFFACLTQWFAMLSGNHKVLFLFSFDCDDVMGTEETLKKLRAAFKLPVAPTALHEAGLVDYEVRVGPAPRTKIQAMNADVNTCRFVWDVLIATSDDMWPSYAGFDDVIAQSVPRPQETADVALHFFDGFRRDELCTLPIMTRAYYRRFDYIYHPAYESLWCDDEYTFVAKSLGRHLYFPTMLFEHRHPVNNRHYGWDELYRIEGSNTQFQRDKAVFEQRKAAGAFNAPPPEEVDHCRAHGHTAQSLGGPILSVLIASLEERAARFKELASELQRQALLLPDPTRVEVLWRVDNGAQHVGDKRNELLTAARGDYVCFIDDDDMVAPTYLSDLLRALHAPAGMPGPDCVVFRGQLTTDGAFTGVFDFDLEHACYKQVGALYQRTPNHLCPIKREIACRVGFPIRRLQEDTDFALRVHKLLKTQAIVKFTDVGGVERKKLLYHYRWSPTGTRTQREQDKVADAALRGAGGAVPVPQQAVPVTAVAVA